VAGNAKPVRIAVLGTGTMGAPIAENLAGAGHEVVVWNRTRARAEAVEGVSVADTPSDAVRGVDVVLTMLTDGDAVESAVGDIATLPLWIQMSTVGIDATEKLMQMARDRARRSWMRPCSGRKSRRSKES
jgi:3-hydroxyisobutyrate dehydrogenase